jgi:hypothetical protein
MKITKIFAVVVAMVAGSGLFVAGYGVGANYSILKNAGDSARFEQGFSAGMMNAKNIVEKSDLFPPEADKVNAIFGKVTAVDGDKITVAASPVSMNPFADQGPATRTIVVSDATTIVALVNKTAAQMSDDFKKFQSDSKGGKTVTPPPPTMEKPAALGDIKLTMTITAYADGDIRDAATIDASKITFQTF